MSTGDKIIPGIHHVTAITSDAQKNIDFYTGVLGLRLVKVTVNYDDPGSYHLYYGDDLGRPGTILTFFAWPGAHRGRIGPPQVTTTAYAIPSRSIEFWSKRLAEQPVDLKPTADRFGQRVLAFSDPDGMQLELIGVDELAGHRWASGSVSAEHAIRAFQGVTISEEGNEETARLLTDLMGYKADGNEQNRFRYCAIGSGVASTVDLLCVPDSRHGTMGAGAVHHVAFRAADDPQQSAWHRDIASRGLNVSPIMDRQYFHSIYFREPGGVLFEIATDSPGFTADQPADQLGKKLMLPPWLEPHRAQIEESLPRLRL